MCQKYFREIEALFSEAIAKTLDKLDARRSKVTPEHEEKLVEMKKEFGALAKGFTRAQDLKDLQILLIRYLNLVQTMLQDLY